MEYIEGECVTAYCRARGSSLEGRLRLFVQICEAVGAAHRNLIVHRDLKPANILVDADGRIRLLDFGIAKLIDPPMAPAPSGAPPLSGVPRLVSPAGGGRTGGRATAPTQNTFTIDYAAPEQLAGEPITTATDVHALGLLLFELLTGRRAWALAGQPLAAALRSLLDSPAPVPSAAAVRDGPVAPSRLRGDLDAIVAKCLRKESAERYQSVDALRLDVERSLRGDVVSARGDGRGYVLGRFVRRHAVATATAASLAAVLLAATAVAVVQRQRAERAAGEARHALARAGAVQAFMTGLFRTTTLAQEDAAAARTLTVQQLIDRGARELETSLQAVPDTRAALWALFGEIYENLDLYEQSVAMRERAVAETRTAFGAHSREHGQAMVELAWELGKRRDRERAGALLREGLEILARVAPRSEEYGHGLSLEASYLRSQHPALAVERGLESVRVLREAGAPRHTTAFALKTLGLAYNDLGSFAPAARALREARDEFESLHGPRSSEVGYSSQGLGDALSAQMRYEESEAAYARAIDIQIATHTAAEIDSARIRLRRALALLALGRRSDAQVERDALEARARGGADIFPGFIDLARAMLASAEGDVPRAIEGFGQSIPQIPPMAAALTISAYDSLAQAYLLQDDLADARKAIDAAQAINRERGAPVGVGVRLVATTAELLAREGHLDEGLQAIDRAARRYKLEEPFSAPRLELALGKARALAAAGRWPEVATTLEGWVALRPDAGIQLPANLEGEVSYWAGMASHQQGEPARALFVRALDALARIDVAGSPRRSRAQLALASMSQ
jgi:serine/threonine-protein kinase